MIDVGYAFSRTRFCDAGCLFRGVQVDADTASGFSDGSGIGERDSHLFERVFGVRFVSQMLGDALSVCHSIGTEIDNALIVMSAAAYNRENDHGRAATLTVGDFGHVFRYPFLATPVDENDVELIVLGRRASDHYKSMGWSAELLFELDCADRRQVTDAVAGELRRRGLRGAGVIEDGRLPGRSDLRPASICPDLGPLEASP